MFLWGGRWRDLYPNVALPPSAFGSYGSVCTTRFKTAYVLLVDLKSTLFYISSKFSVLDKLTSPQNLVQAFDQRNGNKEQQIPKNRSHTNDPLMEQVHLTQRRSEDQCSCTTILVQDKPSMTFGIERLFMKSKRWRWYWSLWYRSYNLDVLYAFKLTHTSGWKHLSCAAGIKPSVEHNPYI